MKEFEVTLTAVSRKTFKLRADSQEDAFLLAEAILENTDLLDFSDEEFDRIADLFDDEFSEIDYDAEAEDEGN